MATHATRADRPVAGIRHADDGTPEERAGELSAGQQTDWRPSPGPRESAAEADQLDELDAERGAPKQHGADAESNTVEAASPESEDDSNQSGTRATKQPRRRLHAWLILALVIACLGLLGAGGVVGVALWQEHRRDTGRTQASEAARAEIHNILTVSPKTVDADVQRILEGATGGFKKDFTAGKDIFKNVVKEQKVTSTGEISALGVESYTENSASFLVAATSMVGNSASSGEPQPRDYRIRVEMQKQGDRWLASQVQFVP